MVRPLSILHLSRWLRFHEMNLKALHEVTKRLYSHKIWIVYCLNHSLFPGAKIIRMRFGKVLCITLCMSIIVQASISLPLLLWNKHSLLLIEFSDFSNLSVTHTPPDRIFSHTYTQTQTHTPVISSPYFEDLHFLSLFWSVK